MNHGSAALVRVRSLLTVTHGGRKVISLCSWEAGGVDR